MGRPQGSPLREVYHRWRYGFVLLLSFLADWHKFNADIFAAGFSFFAILRRIRRGVRLRRTAFQNAALRCGTVDARSLQEMMEDFGKKQKK
jgi:hypothetical protein